MTEKRFLVVDRRNLFYWLSRGLIVPRSLMKKYRADSLDLSPNAFPLTSSLATGRMSKFAEDPVCLELGSEVDMRPKPRVAPSAVEWVSGSLSVRRIARVHLNSTENADDMRAREYRGFDAGELPVAITPALFAEDGISVEAPTNPDALEQSLDDASLRRREAVAGAVMSMFGGQTAGATADEIWQSYSDDEEPISALVNKCHAAKLVERQDDLDLLRATLAAIFADSELGDIVPSTLLEHINTRLAGSKSTGIAKHLERILALTRGEDELKPFRTHGGLLTTKALLLYLLRPDPEAVRDWSTEELNAEEEVLQLSRLLAGFGARYGGLPSSLRNGPLLDAVLDWTARGLQPSDFEISTETVRHGTSSVTKAHGTYGDRSPESLSIVESFRHDLEAGDEGKAVDLATRLGWLDCLRLTVITTAFEVKTAANQRATVSFAPGANLAWSIVQEPFLNRLANLDKAEIESLATPKQAKRRRTSKPKSD